MNQPIQDNGGLEEIFAAQDQAKIIVRDLQKPHVLKDVFGHPGSIDTFSKGFDMPNFAAALHGFISRIITKESAQDILSYHNALTEILLKTKPEDPDYVPGLFDLVKDYVNERVHHVKRPPRILPATFGEPSPHKLNP